MKILNLKFKNINSLSGENEIDFANNVFTNEGIFAITGKTGAGKSSILDSISIALYGKTARVDITGNENPVMTKGEKDCYAEIIFEVNGKIWKSSWSQELTRTGTLKPVKRLIANMKNEIIADQIRNCDKEIVEIIGLTFEQFTKVIMLAQGSFAAFLQAEKNDKGELLEQITGTEIYADISKLVYKINKDETDKLNKILYEYDLVKLLSDEEINILKEENNQLNIERNKINDELQKIEFSKKWLYDISNCEKQLQNANEKLPSLEKQVTVTIDKLQDIQNLLDTTKKEKERLDPIWKKVRELETKISEKVKLINPIKNEIENLETNINNIDLIIESEILLIENLKNSYNEKQNWANDNIKYKELISNFSVIEKDNQQIINKSNEIKKINTELEILQKSFNENYNNEIKALENYNKKNEFLNQKRIELFNKKNEKDNILNGKQLSELVTDRENIKDFGIKISNVIETEISIINSKKEINENNNKILNYNTEKEELTKKIKVENNTKSQLEATINLLDENIKLAKTIQSLEEHRHNLQEGQECPLCGSLEHPYTLSNTPILGEKEKELTILKTQQEEIQNSIQLYNINLAKIISNNENLLGNIEKKQENLHNYYQKQEKVISDIKIIKSNFIIPNSKNKLETFEDILQKTKESYTKINSLINIVEEIEAKISYIRDNELPKLEEDKIKAEKSKTEYSTNIKLINQELNSKKEIKDNLQDVYNTEYDRYRILLKKYSVENLEDLKKCLDKWDNNQVQLETLTNNKTKINNNIEIKKTDLNNQRKLLDINQDKLKNIESEKQTLLIERMEIYENKSVEDNEQSLKIKLVEIETIKTTAEIEKNKANEEYAKIKAIVSDKEKELSETKKLILTNKNIDELQKENTNNKIKLDEISQKIGANNQKLELNNENNKSSISLKKKKETQQQLCNKWGKLNELIGSADGKRYRNFAQALTFEHLISLTNIQLKKMSDRYTLKRTGDNNNPFDLFVIDNYQNNEERTVQNLSGGEKFIISLSLALGLSKIASKNMQIDTMFIDEGFGTLDSDYLDLALNALSNLQSEGKIIGVISHLTELKERIATHIEIIPSGNGFSKIRIMPLAYMK